MIGSKDSRKTLLKGSQSRFWTTFIEAVTADGRILEPAIIFKGKGLQKQWFTNEVLKIAPKWSVIPTKNGWTDNDTGLKWLQDVYLPQTNPADESDARLLILDGHMSHTSVSIIIVSR